MEEIKKLLEDCECAGYRCPHEISGKHYVMISEDVDSIIDLAVSKERERIVEEILKSLDTLDMAENLFPMAIINWSKKDRENWVTNLINTK